MVIQHNLSAMFTRSSLGISEKGKAKTMEKLSSGYKINRAADNTATLSISEKFRAQIRGLSQSQRNIEDGVSYINVAEGALNEVNAMLLRIRELSVQSVNDTNTDGDRVILDLEAQQIKDEIEQVFYRTEFNERKIWQAAFIPDVGGECTDFSFYIEVNAAGDHYGGINYMNHRYSWGDLGIGWDENYNRFTETANYTFNVYELLHNIHNTGIDATPGNDSDSRKDDYISYKNLGAEFIISTKAGTGAFEMEKKYSWFATDEGIYIDNVLTKGVAKGNPPIEPSEGNTTWEAMGLTKGQWVDGGTYTFKYYGMEVSFDVPAGGVSWFDLVGGINNPRVKLDWRSKSVGYAAKQVAEIVKYTPRITINEKNMAYMTKDYRVEAWEFGMYVSSVRRESSDKNLYLDPEIYLDDGSHNIDVIDTFVRWENIGNDEGEELIKSWGLGDYSGDPTNKNNGEPDGDQVVGPIDDVNYVYRYKGTPANGLIYHNDLEFEFNLFKDASRDAVVNDLNGSEYVGKFTSPTQVKGFVASDDKGDFQAAGGLSEISFEMQRYLGREFSSYEDEVVKATDGLRRGTSRYEFTLEGAKNNLNMSSVKTMEVVEEEITNYIVEEVKRLRDAGNIDEEIKLTDLPIYEIEFNNLGFNNMDDKVKVALNLRLSETVYTEGMDVSAYVKEKMDKFLDSASFTMNGDGETYQELELRQNSRFESEIEKVPVCDGYVIGMDVQVGANGGQLMGVNYEFLRLGTLGLRGTDISTADTASRTLRSIDKAVARVSKERSGFGAYVNRLYHAYEANGIIEENMQNAESIMRDADMAKEMVNFLKHNILEQAGQSILAQSNQVSQGVLTLLKN